MADDVRTTAIMKVGGSVQAIVPQSFEDAWRLAAAFAKSGIAPKGMDTPEACLVAIMAGAEVGLPPFQSVQSIAVINGRATMWGDALPAIVRRHGVKVTETIEGEGDAMVATCTATRPDGEVITRTFSVADAKAAGLWGKPGPWTLYRKRMLQMRARGWTLRDGCADMLRGIAMREEVEDFTVESSEPIMEEKPFIKGGKKDELVAVWNESMRRATTPEELDAVMALVANYPGTFSENTVDGLREVYDQEHARICAGEAPREKDPSPFEELKAEGLACLEAENKAEALRKWLSRARSRTLLERCLPAERQELKALEKTLKTAVDGD